MALATGCASVPDPVEQAVSVVPTGVMVREDTPHFGVVSRDSRFHQMACLAGAAASPVVIEIVLESPEAEVVALLRRNDGAADEQLALRPGQRLHRFERRVGSTGLGLCVELVARRGGTVFELTWRRR